MSMISPMIFIEGKSNIKLIIVRIRVIVHAHGFPLSNPHAIKNEIAPSATMILLISPIMALPPKSIIIPIPIEPHNALKNIPIPIAIAPEIISSIARIVTPVGLTFKDTRLCRIHCVINDS